MALACRVFGHRPRFSSEGVEMRWECARGCGAAGSKTYEDAETASRYAAALDRQDTDDLGKRSLASLMPLRLARRGRDS
jgi:hypothetical protein